MTRLDQSIELVIPLLREGDLAADDVVAELLAKSAARRTLDLSDLKPNEQAELIGRRSVDVLPSIAALAEAIESVGGPLTIKLGIDPTSEDVHLGHAVPMLVLSRFQRMGHHIVLIIGDITAKIGDPSGRSTERPTLTDEDIARNLRTYRDQVTPFFDFSKADFRYNSEWLADIKLPWLIDLLAQVPVSMSLQREDFRSRLAEGLGLSMAEFIYSVVMAIDSVELDADVELGGVDQLLNMQMGRRVMEVKGLTQQLVVTLPLIEGLDGSGAKMSKSSNNYVPLTTVGPDMFGKIMSIPDRLTLPYIRAFTEWTDEEIDIATARLEAGGLHPMDLKKIVAGDVVAAVHGVAGAMAARRNFTAQFSRHRFADLDSLPTVAIAAHGQKTVGIVLTRVLGYTSSVSAARRMAQQNGLHVVIENSEGQHSAKLDEDAVMRPLSEAIDSVFRAIPRTGGCTIYLKAGRKLAELEGG